MKKYLSFAIILLVSAAVFAEKSKLTIKNVFGGDFDALGDSDLYTNSRVTNTDGETVSENVFALGDLLQADFENSHIDSRVRMELLYNHSDADEQEIPFFVIAPSGYVHFTPIPQIGIVAGNKFYKHFAIPSAYLAAADDTTKYGRLLTDSLGEDLYAGNEYVALYSNGVSGGLTSDWLFGDNKDIYLKLAAGTTFFTDFDDTAEFSIDFGVNGGIKNRFDLGFTAHNIASDERKFGAFAGLTSVENLILNLGFYYNFTPSDYLPEARVTKSGVYKYKKQTTKYALGLSGGYDFKKIGLGIYADVITGLTNEYIGDIKYYDGDGNLIETKTTTIIRGGTTVKYKNGKKKKKDGYTHEAVPIYSQLRLTYQITDSIEAAFNFKVRAMLRDSDSTWLTFYPRAAIDLPAKAGTIGAGVRLDVNLARYEGLSDISIPLTYTYKFKKKF